MHSVSELWGTLFADGAHRTETKLVIAGTEYGEDRLVQQSVRIDGALYSTFGVGNCCARQIEFSLYPQGTIPRQAKIEAYVRLTLGTQASEWIKKGEFFFSTRKTDYATGVLRVRGYDAMLKAEETWLDASYDEKTWPMPAATAVADIAARMGVEVDARTQLSDAFPVPYPADEEGDMTMREVLARIAVANAGNWIISDEGKLLLVGLNAAGAAAHALGKNLAAWAPGIEAQEITRVELLDKNGDVVAVSGSDTGRTLTALQPDGTAAMAAAILAKVSGYAHRGYEGSGALLDPAAELGDGVTVDGQYVPLIAQDVTLDALYAPDISAPDADELDDEYPYKSATQRQIERNMAAARSLISKTSDEILLKVEGIDGRVSALSVTLDGVTVTDSSGTTRIKGSSIETGSLYVAAANITGTLTASQIQTSSIYVGSLADGASYATKSYVLDNAGLSQSEVDSRIDTYIDETSITAEKLRGKTVQLLASSRTQIGAIELAYTTTGYGIAISSYYGGIQLNSAGNVYLSAGTGGNLTIQSNRVQLGSAALCLSSSYGYGTSTPSGSGVAGQLYVQLVS